ncbi:hypothetical protein TNCV_3974341 [Trichonephila clavipes]|nr:hypothetical protein TNCV_3974341 [Trichonephila clavipes]
MPLSRMENTTFAMPSIIDSHDMELRTVYSPDARKEESGRPLTTPRVFFLKTGVEPSRIVLSPAWCSKLRRKNLTLSLDEFRGP